MSSNEVKDLGVSQTTVFIVDDNPANTLMLKQVVDTEGFKQVHVFNDPELALEQFFVVKPQLVLLDILMPKLSGIEFLQRITGEIKAADVAVIVLTASHDEKQRMQALELGAQDYIEKPINIIETLQRVRNVLNLQQRKNRYQHLSEDLGGRLKKTKRDLSDVILTLNSIFDNSSDYVFVTDKTGLVTECNKLAARRFDIDLSQQFNLFERFKIDEQLLHGKVPELVTTDASNKRLVVEVRYSNIAINNDSHYIFVFKDITTRKEDEINLRFLAETHYISHLPNRNQTESLIEQKCLNLSQGDKLCIIFISFFDNNKIVELHSHERLECLLLNIALALVELATVNDSVLLHWDDNGFLLIERQQFADELIEKIQQRFDKPIAIGEHIEHGVYSKPYLGIQNVELSNSAYTDWFSNIQCALKASYEGARLSKRLMVYDDALHEKIEFTIVVEQELIKAIERQDFKLAYQPKVDLHSGAVVSTEALIRWQHETLGVVGPDVFIPIAESCGLISEIGKWVLQQAVSDIPRLKQLYPELRHVAINVAAQQLNDEFIALLQSECRDGPLGKARFIELEITETSFLDNFERVSPILRQLKELGVRLALDDFGTGYSSLSYLHELPVDTLKIDRAFIMPMITSERSLLLVKSIISMGLALGLEIVAEGIEDKETSNMLADFGVQLGQGYYFYKPGFLD